MINQVAVNIKNGKDINPSILQPGSITGGGQPNALAPSNSRQKLEKSSPQGRFKPGLNGVRKQSARKREENVGPEFKLPPISKPQAKENEPSSISSAPRVYNQKQSLVDRTPVGSRINHYGSEQRENFKLMNHRGSEKMLDSGMNLKDNQSSIQMRSHQSNKKLLKSLANREEMNGSPAGTNYGKSRNNGPTSGTG